MKSHFFFKSQDFVNPNLIPNPEQKTDYKLDKDILRLKQIVFEAIDNFVKNFSIFKRKDGKTRAINYRNEIEQFEGSSTALLHKVYADICKQDGQKPLETSTDLRTKLLQAVADYLQIPFSEITRKMSQQLSVSGTMYADSMVLIEQTRRDVTHELIRKKMYQIENRELKSFDSPRLR